MMQGEREKCCTWNKNCMSVVGQDEAVQAVANAVRRSRAGCLIPIALAVRSCS